MRSWLLLLACAIRPSFPFSSTPRTTIRAEAHRSPGSAFDPAAPTRPFDAPGPSASAGEWASAKRSLRNPKCCVVSVPGLERHLSVLRERFCGDEAPTDLDLRMRVRCGNDGDGGDMTYEDCAKIYDAVVGPSSAKADDPADARTLGIAALEELARGTSSLADGPLEGDACSGVHVRIAIASDYRASDPMWHTDECPLRGYVALSGPGTELASEPCRPWEYAALRAWGSGGLEAFGRGGGGGAGTARVGLRSAEELEFIVMKGDYYEAPPLPEDAPPSAADALIRKVWNRSSACVHRSPPSASSGNSSGGSKGNRRRVILSLDLADGRDDQEWYEVSRKRGWRSGMTQRKSRLVS